MSLFFKFAEPADAEHGRAAGRAAGRGLLMRLCASALAVLLVAGVLAVVAGAPTTASAQTEDDTTEDTQTEDDTTEDTQTEDTADLRQFAGADRYETSAALAYGFVAKAPSSNSIVLAGGGA